MECLLFIKHELNIEIKMNFSDINFNQYCLSDLVEENMNITHLSCNDIYQKYKTITNSLRIIMNSVKRSKPFHKVFYILEFFKFTYIKDIRNDPYQILNMIFQYFYFLDNRSDFNECFSCNIKDYYYKVITANNINSKDFDQTMEFLYLNYNKNNPYKYYDNLNYTSVSRFSILFKKDYLNYKYLDLKEQECDSKWGIQMIDDYSIENNINLLLTLDTTSEYYNVHINFLINEFIYYCNNSENKNEIITHNLLIIITTIFFSKRQEIFFCDDIIKLMFGMDSYDYKNKFIESSLRLIENNFGMKSLKFFLSKIVNYFESLNKYGIFELNYYEFLSNVKVFLEILENNLSFIDKFFENKLNQLIIKKKYKNCKLNNTDVLISNIINFFKKYLKSFQNVDNVKMVLKCYYNFLLEVINFIEEFDNFITKENFYEFFSTVNLFKIKTQSITERSIDLRTLKMDFLFFINKAFLPPKEIIFKNEISIENVNEKSYQHDTLQEVMIKGFYDIKEEKIISNLHIIKEIFYEDIAKEIYISQLFPKIIETQIPLLRKCKINISLLRKEDFTSLKTFSSQIFHLTNMIQDLTDRKIQLIYLSKGEFIDQFSEYSVNQMIKKNIKLMYYYEGIVIQDIFITIADSRILFINESIYKYSNKKYHELDDVLKANIYFLTKEYLTEFNLIFKYFGENIVEILERLNLIGTSTEIVFNSDNFWRSHYTFAFESSFTYFVLEIIFLCRNFILHNNKYNENNHLENIYPSINFQYINESDLTKDSFKIIGNYAPDNNIAIQSIKFQILNKKLMVDLSICVTMIKNMNHNKFPGKKFYTPSYKDDENNVRILKTFRLDDKFSKQDIKTVIFPTANNELSNNSKKLVIETKRKPKLKYFSHYEWNKIQKQIFIDCSSYKEYCYHFFNLKINPAFDKRSFFSCKCDPKNRLKIIYKSKKYQVNYNLEGLLNIMNSNQDIEEYFFIDKFNELYNDLMKNFIHDFFVSLNILKGKMKNGYVNFHHLNNMKLFDLKISLNDRIFEKINDLMENTLNNLKNFQFFMKRKLDCDDYPLKTKFIHFNVNFVQENTEIKEPEILSYQSEEIIINANYLVKVDNSLRKTIKNGGKNFNLKIIQKEEKVFLDSYEKLTILKDSHKLKINKNIDNYKLSIDPIISFSHTYTVFCNLLTSQFVENLIYLNLNLDEYYIKFLNEIYDILGINYELFLFSCVQLKNTIFDIQIKCGISQYDIFLNIKEINSIISKFFNFITEFLKNLNCNFFSVGNHNCFDNKKVEIKIAFLKMISNFNLIIKNPKENILDRDISYEILNKNIENFDKFEVNITYYINQTQNFDSISMGKSIYFHMVKNYIMNLNSGKPTMGNYLKDIYEKQGFFNQDFRYEIDLESLQDDIFSIIKLFNLLPVIVRNLNVLNIYLKNSLSKTSTYTVKINFNDKPINNTIDFNEKQMIEDTAINLTINIPKTSCFNIDYSTLKALKSKNIFNKIINKFKVNAQCISSIKQLKAMVKTSSNEKFTLSAKDNNTSIYISSKINNLDDLKFSAFDSKYRVVKIKIMNIKPFKNTMDKEVKIEFDIITNVQTITLFVKYNDALLKSIEYFVLREKQEDNKTYFNLYLIQFKDNNRTAYGLNHFISIGSEDTKLLRKGNIELKLCIYLKNSYILRQINKTNFLLISRKINTLNRLRKDCNYITILDNSYLSEFYQFSEDFFHDVNYIVNLELLLYSNKEDMINMKNSTLIQINSEKRLLKMFDSRNLDLKRHQEENTSNYEFNNIQKFIENNSDLKSNFVGDFKIQKTKSYYDIVDKNKKDKFFFKLGNIIYIEVICMSLFSSNVDIRRNAIIAKNITFANPNHNKLINICKISQNNKVR